MTFNDTFIGREKHLRVYEGIDILNFVFAVLNEDLTDYSFAGITDINLRIYNHRDGTLLKTLVITDNLTVSGNDVTMNVDYSTDLALDASDLRYYDLIWEDSSNQPIMISYGNFKVI